MRTLVFILLLITIFACGWFLRSKGDIFLKGRSAQSPQWTDSQWEKLLPGTWKIVEKDEGSKESWHLEMILQLDKNHNFQLNGEEKYYTQPNMISVVSGGGTKGTWYVNGSGFTLVLDSCNFNISRSDFRDTDKIRLLKCDSIGQVINFGPESSLNCRSQLEELTEESIIITGTNYITGFKFNQEFTRVR